MQKAIIELRPVFDTVFETAEEARNFIPLDDQMSPAAIKASAKRIGTVVKAAKKNYDATEADVIISSWTATGPDELLSVLPDIANSIDNIKGLVVSYTDVETIEDDE